MSKKRDVPDEPFKVVIDTNLFVLKDDPRLKREMMALGVRILSVPEFLVLLETSSRRAGSE